MNNIEVKVNPISCWNTVIHSLVQLKSQLILHELVWSRPSSKLMQVLIGAEPIQIFYSALKCHSPCSHEAVFQGLVDLAEMPHFRIVVHDRKNIGCYKLDKLSLVEGRVGVLLH